METYFWGGIILGLLVGATYNWWAALSIFIFVFLTAISYEMYADSQKERVALQRELKKNPATTEDTIGGIEQGVQSVKENRIFNVEWVLESPHLVDYRDAFNTMEVNYFRLKQRLSHNSENALEITKDWYKYAESLAKMKFARVMLNVDMSDNAFDNFDKRGKESAIAKEEIERKFKSLLGVDWLEIPPNYFKRQEDMKRPENEAYEENSIRDNWKWYYQGSGTLFEMELQKKKTEKEYEAQKEIEKEVKRHESSKT